VLDFVLKPITGVELLKEVFKLKCNNLILNEIRVLNASYVCLHAFSFIENHPIQILQDGPLISEVVMSQCLNKIKLWNIRTTL
jgi:hypothetical protein